MCLFFMVENNNFSTLKHYITSVLTLFWTHQLQSLVPQSDPCSFVRHFVCSSVRVMIFGLISKTALRIFQIF